MFNNNELASSEKMPCRPDPEKLLEGIRKQIAAIEEADSILLRLIELPVHFNNRTVEEIIAGMFGELRIKLVRLTQEKQKLMNEIDS